MKNSFKNSNLLWTLHKLNSTPLTPNIIKLNRCIRDFVTNNRLTSENTWINWDKKLRPKERVERMNGCMPLKNSNRNRMRSLKRKVKLQKPKEDSMNCLKIHQTDKVSKMKSMVWMVNSPICKTNWLQSKTTWTPSIQNGKMLKELEWSKNWKLKSLRRTLLGNRLRSGEMKHSKNSTDFIMSLSNGSYWETTRKTWSCGWNSTLLPKNSNKESMILHPG